MDTKDFPNYEINSDRVREVLRKTNCCCSICGEDLAYLQRGEFWHIVRMLPRAIGKWVPALDNSFNSYDLIEDLNSIDNLICICNGCINKRISNAYSMSTLCKKYRLNKRNKLSMEQLYTKIKPAVNVYNNHIIKTLNNQNGKCYICRMPLTIKDDLSIRRDDNRKPRSEENSIVLCGRCNARDSEEYRYFNSITDYKKMICG